MNCRTRHCSLKNQRWCNLSHIKVFNMISVCGNAPETAGFNTATDIKHIFWGGITWFSHCVLSVPFCMMISSGTHSVPFAGRRQQPGSTIVTELCSACSGLQEARVRNKSSSSSKSKLGNQSVLFSLDKLVWWRWEGEAPMEHMLLHVWQISPFNQQASFSVYSLLSLFQETASPIAIPPATARETDTL